MTGPCGNCGQTMVLYDGTCITCDTKMRALAPPKELVEMRDLYEGKLATSKGGRIMAQLLEKNPAAFLKLLREGEESYRQSVAALQKEEKEEAGPDSGTERAVELVTRLLKERQVAE